MGMGWDGIDTGLEYLGFGGWTKQERERIVPGGEGEEDREGDGYGVAW